ncbi:MAG: ABC transporter ATP-binding protein [Angelakisella sp.]
MATTIPAVRLSGITKTFGTVVANNNVSLDIFPGEIHALLGENGCGKSTLVNVLSGIYAPDCGSVEIDGKHCHFSAPADAIKAGVGMVHQHFKLVEVLTATENIVLGQHDGLMIRSRNLAGKINEICEKYGLAVTPDKKIYDMSVGEKQTVEILKVLYRGARILILDEPTAVLTPQETANLFNILRNMKREGCSIIIITHKLGEVMDISDRVTVLRKGESIATVETANTNPMELTEMMVGRPIDLEIERPEYTGERVTILRVKDLTATDADGVKLLDNISFHLHRGEILGVAGIAGSGQKELCETIAGLDENHNTGYLEFLGESIRGLSPKEIIKRGISMSFIPEDRLGMGLVAGMSIVDNVLLKTYGKRKGLFVDRKEGTRLADHIIKKFDISTPSRWHAVKKLSGGNIQKVLLGREIDLNPQLLITAYPVRGLDIGASYNIYEVLGEQKKAGVGVLFIGEDLDVLMALCDRIVVLSGGAVMDIVDPTEVTKEDIGMLMLGHKKNGEVGK